MTDLHAAGGHSLLGVAAPVIALVGVAGYLLLVRCAHSRGRSWPTIRIISWATGCVAAAAAVSGPLAERAGDSFVGHIVTHLLIGMLAPLLLVLAIPVTLLLRAMEPRRARRVVRIMALPPIRWLTEPTVAAGLVIGGMIALYGTGLYAAMQHHPALHLLVHAHLFLAGYLFTASILCLDPMPHRRRPLHRAVVLILTLAAHDTVAKYLYAHPPEGVAGAAAETGSMLMYYGGDVIELAIVVLFCARWYRAARPRAAAGAARAV